MSDFKDILKEERTAVNRIIKKELEGLKKNIYPSLYSAMEYALFPGGNSGGTFSEGNFSGGNFSGGKRVRPIIVNWFAQTSNPDKDILSKTITAVEFIHTYSLIHDDLPAMDDDDTRRGQPSVHIKFSQGEAILAGDALLTEAFFLLAQTGLSRLALILAESAGSSGMVGGQAADIDLNTVKSGNDYGKSSERSSGKSSEKNSGKDIDYINNLKTAKLFEAAASMGAVIAGGSENDIEKAAVFGVNLGRAFQLRDDLLDDESEDIAQTRKKALGFVDRAKKTIMDINGSRNLVRIADYVINRDK